MVEWGGVDLSDQLLQYFSFLSKSTKWSRKLLIHMFNLVILNVYILKKHYGCEKLTHNEYRDKIVKYLLAEGLKNYNIPLPPLISRRIGKYHKDEHNSKRLCEWHFPTCIPKGGAEKGRNLQGVGLFVVKYLGSIEGEKNFLLVRRLWKGFVCCAMFQNLSHTNK